MYKHIHGYTLMILDHLKVLLKKKTNMVKNPKWLTVRFFKIWLLTIFGKILVIQSDLFIMFIVFPTAASTIVCCYFIVILLTFFFKCILQ